MSSRTASAQTFHEISRPAHLPTYTTLGTHIHYIQQLTVTYLVHTRKIKDGERNVGSQTTPTSYSSVHYSDDLPE